MALRIAAGLLLKNGQQQQQPQLRWVDRLSFVWRIPLGLRMSVIILSPYSYRSLGPAHSEQRYHGSPSRPLSPEIQNTASESRCFRHETASLAAFDRAAQVKKWGSRSCSSAASYWLTRPGASDCRSVTDTTN